MASFHDERTPIAGRKKRGQNGGCAVQGWKFAEDEGVVEGIYICFFP